MEQVGGGGGGGGSAVSTSPSFSCDDSNSINNFARIANIVCQELNNTERNLGLEDTEDGDFEFACLHTHQEAFTVSASADDIFSNGKIRPIFPIEMTPRGDFNENGDDKKMVHKGSSNPLRHTLMKLMNEERDSDSETMEVKNEKKSSSTGTSKRWSLRDLIHRSNSDGRENVVVLARSSSTTCCSKSSKNNKRDEKAEVSKEKRCIKNKKKNKKSAHEVHYTRNRALKEAERRRSYLPYKQDLVALFASVNGLSKHLHPF